jgi:glucose/arabinose dehydrogenase
MRSLRLMAGVVCSVAALGGVVWAKEPALNLVKLPAGFKIELYTDAVPGARSLAVSDKGTLFVSSKGDDHVYAVQDTDGDGKAETVHPIGKGLNSPNGIAFKDGALYVAEISRILRYDNIEATLAAPPEPVVVIDTLPTEGHHGWKYLAFGPDGNLYFNIGAPCNVCGPDVLGTTYATIHRIKPDGTGLEAFASGVRNSVGITWHPTTGDMWFTDNGRDMMGDDTPPCELNKATAIGQHFGFPYCHGGDIPDPEFAGDRKCEEFIAPAQNMGAHVAPLGLRFNTGSQFPAEYKGALFIAEHGSWNRSIPQGYRISVVKFDEQGNALPWEVFAEGWLRRTLAWGRPVDVLFQADGSMLVSDDKSGAVYRISYAG